MTNPHLNSGEFALYQCSSIHGVTLWSIALGSMVGWGCFRAWSSDLQTMRQTNDTYMLHVPFGCRSWHRYRVWEAFSK
jgi:hypothetical protein